MAQFVVGREVGVHIAQLTKKIDKACIPGAIVEVKERTGIVVCEFMVGNEKFTEDFWLKSGLSIRGEEFGYIAPLSCEKEATLIEDLTRARDAWKKDDHKAFAEIRDRILHTVVPITGGACSSMDQVVVKQFILFFCKEDDGDPKKTMQAIMAYTKE